ncbi:hypothetical protein ASPCAL02424 [Aspergillus calidoustus]|uniref:Rhodopsin domain-containing protein n=1 Tax=Aspergillus calidoustus TaxID=454130 RepID=A0A0U5GNI0_ASPCI|nr:hypothetical protein ASPCAL02424 [Aspergillus calidoustus]
MSGQTESLLVATIVMTSISTLVIITRITFRACLIRTVGWDDWIVLLATMINIGISISIILGVGRGLGGRECSDNPNDQTLSKLHIATQLLYTVTAGLIKISILIMYHRVFLDLQVITILTIIFIVAMSVAFFFTYIFQCDLPDPCSTSTEIRKRKCLPALGFWTAASAVFVTTDIWIVVLPIKIVLNLQLSWEKRITVLVVFSLGLLSCGAGIARLIYIVKLYDSIEPPSWTSAPIQLCSMLEVSLALVACSIAPLKKGAVKIKEYLTRDSAAVR